jgi:DNA helicase-2/ATP-dependent DNA helicase PcrA
MADEFRVYGPPGTGKTTWLARTATADARRYGEDQVSICSLTNAAVREVMGRDTPLDTENVTTLHARCKRSLHAPAPAEDAVKLFVDEYPNHARDLPQSLFRDKEDDEAETILSGGRLTPYERMNLARQQMLPIDTWDSDAAYFASHWLDFCEQMHQLDYTGWLESARDEGALPEQQVVYVDEAQDHTPLQLDVIRNWRAKQRVLIGDDDQNLYEWSGAMPRAFLSPELDADHESVLSQSYRVPRSVHALATDWILGASYRHPKEYAPRDADGKVVRHPFSLMDAELGLLPEGLLQDAGTYMVLASCGYMLDPIIGLLRDRGIPFHNPYRPSNKKWNPLGSARERLTVFRKSRWTGSDVTSWASALKKGAFLPERRDPLLAWCQSHPDDHVRWEWVESVFPEQILDRIWSRDLRIFTDFRRTGLTGSWDYAIKVMERPESEREPRIIIGTIHSVKGGQADHVYLMPDLSRAGFLEYATTETRDRIIRLFYVGMTRSYRTLYLCNSSGGSFVQWKAA